MKLNLLALNWMLCPDLPECSASRFSVLVHRWCLFLRNEIHMRQTTTLLSTETVDDDSSTLFSFASNKGKDLKIMEAKNKRKLRDRC